MRAFAPAVYGVVLGFVDARDADDVAQEVFLKVVQGLPSFDGRSQLGTWVYRIATNVGLNFLRSRKRKPAPARLTPDIEIPSGALSADAALDERAARAAFQRALDELGEDLRAVVVLRVHQGLSFDEIAAVLGIPRPTAESRMARARERLRAPLRPFLEDEHARAEER